MICVIGCPASDMLLGKQCLSESAIIACGERRNEEQAEMKTEYRYVLVRSKSVIVYTVLKHCFSGYILAYSMLQYRIPYTFMSRYIILYITNQGIWRVVAFREFTDLSIYSRISLVHLGVSLYYGCIYTNFQFYLESNHPQ
jgi:hypothetical protein